MFEDILKYQNKDLELIKTQKTLETLPSRRVVSDMVALVKELQGTSVSLEKQAGVLKKSYDDCVKELTKLNERLNEFDDSVDMETGIATLTKINNAIINLQNKLSKLKNKMEDVLKQFDNAKKKVVKAKEKHKQAKQDVERKEAELNAKIELIKKEQAEARKGVDAVLIKKYDELKADNVMPVFVQKIEDSCGGCRMGLSAKMLETLKGANHVQCEHCRRIIINKE